MNELDFKLTQLDGIAIHFRPDIDVDTLAMVPDKETEKNVESLTY